MAEQFIGVTVLATLIDPPNAKVRGLVQAVVEQQLTLSKVTWLSTGASTDSLVIEGWNLSDLDIESSAPPPPPPPPQPTTKAPVDDPAILSYGRRGTGDDLSLHSLPNESTPKSRIGVKELSLVQHSLPDVSTPPAIAIQMKENHFPSITLPKEETTTSATLTAPFSDLAPVKQADDTEAKPGISSTEPNGTPEGSQEPARTVRKKARRGQRTGNLKEALTPISYQTEKVPAHQGLVAVKSAPKRGKRSGWRETPFTETPTVADPSKTDPVEPSPSKPRGQSLRPHPGQHKGRRRRVKESDHDDQNGWATGEATDIQDLGDFDFQENLSKFDKRKVFDQIRQEDTTADEDRLVSFNRLPARPGTAGGKNLHHTENVLDSPKPKLAEHSSIDSDLEDGDGPKPSSGRSSRRNLSRTSARKTLSRKASALTATDPHMTGSEHLSSTHAQTQTPSIMKDPGSRSRKPSSQTSKPSLLIAKSGHPCPCISPLQALELEQLAITELGLTEDMMTENAGHGIAYTALDIVLDGYYERDIAGQRVSPLIVLLVGNHKTGSRAIAAARHLRNHGALVVLCLLGIEREDELLESVRRQLQIYRNCGGRAIKQEQLMKTLKQFQRETDLIVDAMLGIHLSFDDLRTDDQAAYFQLVYWTNSCQGANGRGHPDILALDVPSGIDASTGIRAMHDDSELAISATNVLSLAAPKSGLLTALARKEDSIGKKGLLVADIGISNSVWKKFGTRRRHGIDFQVEWVTSLKYHDGTM